MRACTNLRVCLQVVSFLHHQAAQRLSHNPFEARDVVGVTSFLDLGLQVSHAVPAQHLPCCCHADSSAPCSLQLLAPDLLLHASC